MHPKHVVGVIGAPDLQTRWRWGIQSFATWQVRYIMFAGTGSLMGFDSRLTVGVNRTEVFWPYLWGRTPLVDDEFTGHHPLFGF